MTTDGGRLAPQDSRDGLTSKEPQGGPLQLRNAIKHPAKGDFKIKLLASLFLAAGHTAKLQHEETTTKRNLIV